MTLLALDLGTSMGWAAKSADGSITSGTAEFRNDRWQGETSAKRLARGDLCGTWLVRADCREA